MERLVYYVYSLLDVHKAGINSLGKRKRKLKITKETLLAVNVNYKLEYKGQWL